MKIIEQNSIFVVIDDFLLTEHLQALQLQLAFTEYEFIHSKKWVKAWRPEDGNPLIGPEFSFKNNQGVKVKQPKEFPTNKPIDELISKIMEIKGLIEPVVGCVDVNWVEMLLRPYIYPVGTGLGWHEDGQIYSGAFIYYCHPKWHATWGGELMIIEKSHQPSFKPEFGKVKISPKMDIETFTGQLGPEFGWHSRDSTILEEGIGRFILPKPNRIVFLNGQNSHCIKPVTQAAGNNYRCSIAGAFNAIK